MAKREWTWYSNPSLGLGVWGPLVPANDCLWCRNVCISLQIAAAVALMWKPGRNTNRSVWTNRGIRLAGVLSGSYLMLMAGLEGSRYLLRSDPWYVDAVSARKNAPEGPSNGILSQWFGPKNYKACSFDEFVRRANTKSFPKFANIPAEDIQSIVKMLRATNRTAGESLLAQIKQGTFRPPNKEPPKLELVGLENIAPETLEFDQINYFAHIEALLPINLVILPTSGLQINEANSD